MVMIYEGSRICKSCQRTQKVKAQIEAEMKNLWFLLNLDLRQSYAAIGLGYEWISQLPW